MGAVLLGSTACEQQPRVAATGAPPDLHPEALPAQPLPTEATTLAAPPLVVAARKQVGQTLTYDPAYVGLAYPGGDVPRDRGVCTDVIIRALREARNLDLQKEVHEDMRAHFAAYPKNWGLTKPDKNIDHRRVPNLRRYFERQGWSLPVKRDQTAFQPGDIVTCNVGNRPHIMLVSDRTRPDGLPLVLHNIGRGAAEEDALLHYKLTGHYRLK